MPTKEEVKQKIMEKKGIFTLPIPEKKTEIIYSSERKFFFFSVYGEIIDLALAVHDEGYEVVVYIPDKDYEKVGNGMIQKEKQWYRYLSKGYIWVFDGCDHGDMQDWLREKGEAVCGGTQEGDDLENERQMNQEWFQEAGFYQPFSQNFKDIDECIAFAEDWYAKNNGKRLILKQNGEAPKALNHIGKFEGGEDMIFHLEELKKGWNTQQYGDFDCDLMEVVEGLEVAASAFFNGHNYLKNKEGKVVGYLNFEEKKECDGGLGQTTGETGTTFLGVDEDNELFKEILLKPEIINRLQKMNFRGVFDINCIVTDEGIVALEPTQRWGIPATSYAMMEGLLSDPGELIEATAKGLDTPIDIYQGWGQVLVVTARPYPIEVDLEDEATSIGEKLWILKNGSPVNDFSKEQKKHIHLFNFERKEDEKTGELCYKVVTKNGYLLTITGKDGENLHDVRHNLREYVKENIYISGMKYRQDIGKRVEIFLEEHSS